MIRVARISDVPSLVELENISFQTDRLSRRNFRHILSKGKSRTWVYEENQRVVGYIMVLFHSGTSLARLYSIAVHPEFRKKKIARKLIKVAEDGSREADAVSIRLEVNEHNIPAQKLYKKLGYKKIGCVNDYYEDHTNAIRMEKMLITRPKKEMVKVPYYEQTLDFTCGPAVLLMAMCSFDSSVTMDRSAELQIWREATTIFMTSGHGGCGPYGLALAAYKRGYDVEIYLRNKEIMFLDSVRSQDKKEVIQLVQEDFAKKVKELPVKVSYRSIYFAELKEEFNKGGIPIVLISSYRIYQEKSPHWVVITGFDDRYIYCHDPFVDYEKHKSQIDCINMPIHELEFERMARYGKSGQKAVIIIKKRMYPE